MYAHHSTINDLYTLAGYRQQQLADDLDIHVRSLKNYEREERCPRVVEYAMLYLCGYINGKAWKGYQVKKGVLWTPNNLSYRPGQIEGIQMLQQTLSAYQRAAEIARENRYKAKMRDGRRYLVLPPDEPIKQTSSAAYPACDQFHQAKPTRRQSAQGR